MNNKILYQHNNRYLCLLEREHIFKLKDWRNAQMEILRQSTPLTDSCQEKWYASLKDDKKQVLFSLKTGDSNNPEFIGYCGITNIDSKNRRGEISFLVNPKRVEEKEEYEQDFRAVLFILCQYGFEELGLNKIFTDVYEFRKDIIKILEDFGFYKEGELREHYFGKGRHFNSFIHSLLLSEWKLLKNKEIKK